MPNNYQTYNPCESLMASIVDNLYLEELESCIQVSAGATITNPFKILRVLVRKPEPTVRDAAGIRIS